jgi:hypothetical protein
MFGKRGKLKQIKISDSFVFRDFLSHLCNDLPAIKTPKNKFINVHTHLG